MKVLLRHDGKMPNLAIMKLSAYFKQLGYDVGLNVKNPNLICSSWTFTWNAPKINTLHEYEGIPHLKGGSGIDLKTELPYQIEHIMPDYSLYDLDYSMGFTTRGCIRKCRFCIVPIKEGSFREHAQLGEFLHPDHNFARWVNKRIYKSDPIFANYSGLSNKEIFQFLKEPIKCLEVKK